jgi:hypothetical protein
MIHKILCFNIKAGAKVLIIYKFANKLALIFQLFVRLFILYEFSKIKIIFYSLSEFFGFYPDFL